MEINGILFNYCFHFLYAGETPKSFDITESDQTQQENQDDLVKTDQTTSLDKKISLDKFLAKNTSEDNASFEKIMEATRAKRREKHNWLYQQQNELHERLDASKALPGSFEAQILAIENKSNNLDTWKYVAKNALMYPPEGVEKSAEEMLNDKGKKEKQIRHENTRYNLIIHLSNVNKKYLLYIIKYSIATFLAEYNQCVVKKQNV